jgi:hypothetical protein
MEVGRRQGWREWSAAEMTICLDQWWEFVAAAIFFVLPWFMFLREVKKVVVLKRCWIKMSDFCIERLNDVKNELSFSFDVDPTKHSYTLNERVRLRGEVVDEHARLQTSAGVRNSTLREPFRT